MRMLRATLCIMLVSCYAVALCAADAEIMVIRPGSTEWKTTVSDDTELWQSTSDKTSLTFKPVLSVLDRVVQLVEKLPLVKPLEPRGSWDLKSTAFSYGVNLHTGERKSVRIAGGYAFGHSLFEQKKAFQEFRYRDWDGAGLFFGVAAIFRF